MHRKADMQLPGALRIVHSPCVKHMTSATVIKYERAQLLDFQKDTTVYSWWIEAVRPSG